MDSKAKVRILKHLLMKPDWIFSESEIARDLQIPKTTAFRKLKSLADTNILLQFKKGRATVYRVNNNNYIVKELLIPLMKAETDVIAERIKKFCRQLNPKVGILFGSVARNEMTPNSDIDIAIIVSPRDMSRIEKRASEIKNKIFENEGILISTLVFEAAEFKKRYRNNDMLIKEIAAGKVIWGNLDEVL